MSDAATADTQAPPSDTVTQEAPAATAQPGTDNTGQATQDASKPEGEGNDTAGAPEAYEAFTLPEGYALDGERLEYTQTIFKDVGLNQANAQKLIDAFVKVDGENQGAVKALLEQQQAKQVEQWGVEAKQQLGDKYEETLGLAKTAVQAINDPEVTKAFDELGWGNHPAMVRAFAFFGKLGRDSSTDGLGGSTTSAAKSAAAKLWPGLPAG